VTHTSADHLVTVEVGPGNAVTSLELAPQAVRRHNGASLGALIVDTIHEAVEHMNQTMAERISQVATTPDDATRALTSLTWRLPSFEGLEHEADDADLDDVPEPELPPEWADRPVPPEFAASLKLVEELRAEARRQREAYEKLRADLTALTSTAASPDGEVQVTLRGGGEVVRIDIDDSALRRGATRVASLVLNTLHQAQATLAGRLAEAVQEVAGTRLNLRDLVRTYLPDDVEKGSGNG
jgi:DNA-binding protein YbaB